KPHLSDSTAKLPAGTYHLATIQGQIEGQTDNIILEGITGTAAKLKTEGNKILLEVRALRQATNIEWDGNKAGSVWDFAETENFINNGMPDVFVDRDEVSFTDNAQSKTVIITGSLTPASIFVNATEDYIFDGTGNITGITGLTKTGSGTLTINNINSFTGKVAINQGTISLNKLPNNQNVGAIGAASANASMLEINGGTLHISGENNSNRAMTIGSLGGTINNTQKVVLNEAITGDTLTKTGIGNLVFAAPNTHKSTIITEGTISLLNDATNPGQTIIMHGGTLQCNDNSSSYSTLPWNIEIADGKTAGIKLDSRAYYTGNISGNGTLNMHIPFVRSDLNGDMTAFTGTLNCLSSTGSEVELRINNSKGLPNAHLIVNNSVSALNASGSTIEIGALSGNGTLSGDENYKIGSKDTDSQFDGIIAAGSLTKSGDGVFTLTNSNTYTGPTIVNRGTLFVANKTGSATGTGDVNVKILATLSGDGIIGGNVTVEKNATLAPGSQNIGKFLSIEKSVTLKEGSTFEVKTNPSFNMADYLKASENISISGKLKITNTTTREYIAGNEFKILDCKNISGNFEAIYPEKPGDDLVWNTSELYSTGIIKVEAKTSALIQGEGVVKVFPNPFNNNINIESQTNENLQISISTLSGKTILNIETKGKQNVPLNLGTLDRGIYLLKVIGQNSIHYKRIIKQQ
ncbi:MAG: autotransporter-associated beta strand repeat-containing protein, partial [Prolixibacteraceae bacterium]|nr:autotransporter-associated beta strand repeat-containing protein [Prolixibacteraceae bacterium]